MTIQVFIVTLVVIGAVIYAAVSVFRKSRLFSTSNCCGHDCGPHSPSKS